MGRVVTEATVENLEDLYAVKLGVLQPEQIRRVVIEKALVDTGASTLSLPTRFILELGLTKLGSRRIISSTGKAETDMYGTVRLTIQGRDCPVDVLEVPDSVPTLIGQILLEQLDLVVDLRGGKLIGNPAHGGEQVFEMY